MKDWSTKNYEVFISIFLFLFFRLGFVRALRFGYCVHENHYYVHENDHYFSANDPLMLYLLKITPNLCSPCGREDFPRMLNLKYNKRWKLIQLEFQPSLLTKWNKCSQLRIDRMKSMKVTMCYEKVMRPISF